MPSLASIKVHTSIMELEKKAALVASLSGHGTIACSCFVLRRSPIEDDARDTSFKPGLHRQAELAVLCILGFAHRLAYLAGWPCIDAPDASDLLLASKFNDL